MMKKVSNSHSSIIDSINFRIVKPVIPSVSDHREITKESISMINTIGQFRGQVIYENGLRPSFRLADGSYADYCAFDRITYHILADFDKQLVGCVRLYLLSTGKPSYCEKFIGRHGVEKIASDLEVSYHELSEVSRWVVQPELRGKNLGKFLMAGMAFLASKLKQKIVLAMSGTRREQDQSLIRMGFQPVPDIPLYPESTVLDDLRLVYLDLRNLEKTLLASKITKISCLLNLS